MSRDILTIVVGTKRGDIYCHLVSGELEEYQEIVGGYIEHVWLPELIEQGIILVANEEGLLKGLPVNENLLPFFYVGQVFFVGRGDEDLVSLTPDQMHFISSWLRGLEEVR